MGHLVMPFFLWLEEEKMETKYVILMHNLEDHSFEESPLLDSYPKPELIQSYLEQSKFCFAKVEKRYALYNMEETHSKMNQRSKIYEIYYLADDGSTGMYGTSDKEEFLSLIKGLEENDIPHIHTPLEGGK